MSKVFNFTLSEFNSSYVDGQVGGTSGAIATFYDSSGSTVGLTSTSCADLGSNGLVSFQLSNFASQPSTYSQYTYEINREGNTFFGSVIAGSQENLAQTCKVFFRLHEANGDVMEANKVYSEINKIFAEVQSTFYQASTGLYFYKNKIKPDYDQNTSQVSWYLPQGASVKFFVSQLRINSTTTVPSQSEINLYDLLNP